MPKFTERYVKNLRPKGERYDHRETDGEGFGIRVFPSGKRSWFFIYHFNGRKRRLTIGEYPHMPLALAHKRHKQALAKLAEGIDPAEEQAQQSTLPTVADLVDEYMEKWAKRRKRTWQEDERQLQKDILPKWGRRKATEIKRRDVLLVLESLTQRGSPIAANRLLAVVRRMFNFAVEQGILETSPCTHIKAPAKENRKDRVLSAEEIRTMWQGLDTAAMSEESRRALKLILVTAQRPSEVLGTHVSEIDGNWWTLPPERAKNGHAHRVPLSDLAIELIGKQTAAGYVFPSPRKRVEHMHTNALPHALKRNWDHLKMEHFTPHDLRRTAASHMTGMGIPRLVVSKILNHVEPSVTAVYDRHSYDMEKRRALDAWAKQLKSMVEDA